MKPEHERAREIGERLGEMDERALAVCIRCGSEVSVEQGGKMFALCDICLGQNPSNTAIQTKPEAIIPIIQRVCSTCVRFPNNGRSRGECTLQGVIKSCWSSCSAWESRNQ